MVWDAEQLMVYLEDPKEFLEAYLESDSVDNNMKFKLRKEDERADIIAYLESLAE